MKERKYDEGIDSHARNHALYESIWSQGEIAYGHARMLNSREILEKIANEKTQQQ